MAEEAAQEVRRIFAQNTVQEALEYHASVTRNIEESTTSLKGMIGDSYKELMDACSRIVKMKKTCKAVMEMHERFSSSAVPSATGLSGKAPGAIRSSALGGTLEDATATTSRGLAEMAEAKGKQCRLLGTHQKLLHIAELIDVEVLSQAAKLLREVREAIAQALQDHAQEVAAGAGGRIGRVAIDATYTIVNGIRHGGDQSAEVGSKRNERGSDTYAVSLSRLLDAAQDLERRMLTVIRANMRRDANSFAKVRLLNVGRRQQQQQQQQMGKMASTPASSSVSGGISYDVKSEEEAEEDEGMAAALSVAEARSRRRLSEYFIALTYLRPSANTLQQVFANHTHTHDRGEHKGDISHFDKVKATVVTPTPNDPGSILVYIAETIVIENARVCRDWISSHSSSLSPVSATSTVRLCDALMGPLFLPACLQTTSSSSVNASKLLTSGHKAVMFPPSHSSTTATTATTTTTTQDGASATVGVNNSYMTLFLVLQARYLFLHLSRFLASQAADASYAWRQQQQQQQRQQKNKNITFSPTFAKDASTTTATAATVVATEALSEELGASIEASLYSNYGGEDGDEEEEEGSCGGGVMVRRGITASVEELIESAAAAAPGSVGTAAGVSSKACQESLQKLLRIRHCVLFDQEANAVNPSNEDINQPQQRFTMAGAEGGIVTPLRPSLERMNTPVVVGDILTTPISPFSRYGSTASRGGEGSVLNEAGDATPTAAAGSAPLSAAERCMRRRKYVDAMLKAAATVPALRGIEWTPSGLTAQGDDSFLRSTTVGVIPAEVKEAVVGVSAATLDVLRKCQLHCLYPFVSAVLVHLCHNPLTAVIFYASERAEERRHNRFYHQQKHQASNAPPMVPQHLSSSSSSSDGLDDAAWHAVVAQSVSHILSSGMAAALSYTSTTQALIARRIVHYEADSMLLPKAKEIQVEGLPVEKAKRQRNSLSGCGISGDLRGGDAATAETLLKESVACVSGMARAVHACLGDATMCAAADSGDGWKEEKMKKKVNKSLVTTTATATATAADALSSHAKEEEEEVVWSLQALLEMSQDAREEAEGGNTVALRSAKSAGSIDFHLPPKSGGTVIELLHPSMATSASASLSSSSSAAAAASARACWFALEGIFGSDNALNNIGNPSSSTSFSPTTSAEKLTKKEAEEENACAAWRAICSRVVVATTTTTAAAAAAAGPTARSATTTDVTPLGILRVIVLQLFSAVRTVHAVFLHEKLFERATATTTTMSQSSAGTSVTNTSIAHLDELLHRALLTWLEGALADFASTAEQIQKSQRSSQEQAACLYTLGALVDFLCGAIDQLATIYSDANQVTAPSRAPPPPPPSRSSSPLSLPFLALARRAEELYASLQKPWCDLIVVEYATSLGGLYKSGLARLTRACVDWQDAPEAQLRELFRFYHGSQWGTTGVSNTPATITTSTAASKTAGIGATQGFPFPLQPTPELTSYVFALQGLLLYVSSGRATSATTAVAKTGFYARGGGNTSSSVENKSEFLAGTEGAHSLPRVLPLRRGAMERLLYSPLLAVTCTVMQQQVLPSMMGFTLPQRDMTTTTSSFSSAAVAAAALTNPFASAAPGSVMGTVTAASAAATSAQLLRDAWPQLYMDVAFLQQLWSSKTGTAGQNSSISQPNHHQQQHQMALQAMSTLLQHISASCDAVVWSSIAPSLQSALMAFVKSSALSLGCSPSSSSSASIYHSGSTDGAVDAVPQAPSGMPVRRVDRFSLLPIAATTTTTGSALGMSAAALGGSGAACGAGAMNSTVAGGGGRMLSDTYTIDRLSRPTTMVGRGNGGGGGARVAAGMVDSYQRGYKNVTLGSTAGENREMMMRRSDGAAADGAPSAGETARALWGSTQRGWNTLWGGGGGGGGGGSTE